MFMNSYQNLDCEDILFILIDIAVSKIEPTVVNFEREGLALKNMSQNISYVEKVDFIRRCNTAKEMLVYY